MQKEQNDPTTTDRAPYNRPVKFYIQCTNPKGEIGFLAHTGESFRVFANPMRPVKAYDTAQEAQDVIRDFRLDRNGRGVKLKVVDTSDVMKMELAVTPFDPVYYIANAAGWKLCYDDRQYKFNFADKKEDFCTWLDEDIVRNDRAVHQKKFTNMKLVIKRILPVEITEGMSSEEDATLPEVKPSLPEKLSDHDAVWETNPNDATDFTLVHHHFELAGYRNRISDGTVTDVYGWVRGIKFGANAGKISAGHPKPWDEEEGSDAVELGIFDTIQAAKEAVVKANHPVNGNHC